MSCSDCLNISEYFTKPWKPFGGDIGVKQGLPKYATKADLKGATGVDISNLPAKSDVTS